MSDHVHMCISIPPKFAVSNVVGFIKARVRSRWHGTSALCAYDDETPSLAEIRL